MVRQTEHPLITRDDAILSGEPVVRDTRTPVRAVVELWRMGVPAEEIPVHLPHLTVGQVFAALSYFTEHSEEILEHIRQNQPPSTEKP